MLIEVYAKWMDFESPIEFFRLYQAFKSKPKSPIFAPHFLTNNAKPLMNKAISDLSSHTPMMQQYYWELATGRVFQRYALAIV